MKFPNFAFFCLIFTTLQLGFSQYLSGHINRQDVYPFYAWDIFSFKDPNISQYFVFLHELNGETFDPPLESRTERERLNSPQTSILSSQIESFGQALETSANGKATALLQKELERNLFDSVSSATYEVVLGRIHTVEFLKSGALKERRSLGVFRYEKTP